ncbi:MAB_1171c family putative transporter [Peterkaempfera sp. SMS 1(5)a]|uniref:MAB_1171c family putative transporter n=1 Tax=Peterkaempfera podocarpi TaxID=3232308 RepID=UPI00366C0A4D
MSDTPEGPYNAVYLAICVLAWTVVVFKLRALRRDASTGLLVLALATALPATAFGIAAPVVYRALDRAAGVPNLATLGVYVFISGFSASAMVLALLWTPPDERSGERTVWEAAPRVRDRLRRRLLVFAVALPTMAVLFLTSGRLAPETPLVFDTTFAGRPTVAAFLAIYQLLFGYALLDIGRVCWRHASRLPGGWLRRGVRMIAVGCLLTLGYVVSKLIAIGATVAGVGGLDWLSTSAGPAFAAAGALLVTPGFAIPATAAWLRRRHAYRTLRPLWQAVYRADDRLALESPPPAWTESLAVRDLEWRTVRRVLEIRDGQAALRPWVDQESVDRATRAAQAAGLAPRDRDALVVAAALTSALRALDAGQPGRDREDQVPLPGLTFEPEEERDHLLRVALAMRAPLPGATVPAGSLPG